MELLLTSLAKGAASKLGEKTVDKLTDSQSDNKFNGQTHSLGTSFKNIPDYVIDEIKIDEGFSTKTDVVIAYQKNMLKQDNMNIIRTLLGVEPKDSIKINNECKSSMIEDSVYSKKEFTFHELSQAIGSYKVRIGEVMVNVNHYPGHSTMNRYAIKAWHHRFIYNDWDSFSKLSFPPYKFGRILTNDKCQIAILWCYSILFCPIMLPINLCCHRKKCYSVDKSIENKRIYQMRHVGCCGKWVETGQTLNDETIENLLVDSAQSPLKQFMQ
jgi:hypothetical protein